MIAMSEIIKPVIKWVGGKTQILEEVLAAFPTSIDNYYEPFLGGGSVLLGFLSYCNAGKIRLRGNIYAGDANANLIAMYKNIQTDADNVISELKRLSEEYAECPDSKIKDINRKLVTEEHSRLSKEHYYYWIRSKYNSLTVEERSLASASAMFIFLNKTGFRGLYREGPNGYNVPFGNYKNPAIYSEEHIMHVSDAIKDVIFINTSYEELVSDVYHGDFIYFDPPYAPETGTSFVSYTSEGFTLENHERLFALCNEMHDKNIRFVMSNADVGLIHKHFDSSLYKIQTISCKRCINSKKPESRVNEVLIANSS
jgi:DNA adenine methylase